MSESFSFDSFARGFSYNSRKIPFEGNISQSFGWKVSYLADVFTKTFVGYSNVPFSIDSKFTCKKDFHISPNPDCVCGFHAYFDKNTALYNLERWRPFLMLEVEFFGDIILYSQGLRASEQVVKSLHIPSRCGYGLCTKESDGVNKFHRFFRPVCQKHLTAEGYNLSDLEKALGVPVIKIPR
jgi:hypothetical protein